MCTENLRKDVYLDLSVNDGGSDFSTSIADELAEANQELDTLNETIDSLGKIKPDCDKLDYILAAGVGSLCGVLDIFFVGKPKESELGDITDKVVAKGVMNFAKVCHPENRDFDSLDSAIRYLEDRFRVPYDQTGMGDAGKEVFDLKAKNHHFRSLAHNPSLLGLFFSITDQFDNTSHFVSGGQFVTLYHAKDGWELKGNNIPGKLFCGFTNWIMHLISDVSGSSSSAGRGMGIPSPLWTWINDIIVIKTKLKIEPGALEKSISELAVKIFESGYDLRFQMTQTIPVLLNELVTRLVYAVRRLFRYLSETPASGFSFEIMWEICEPFKNATVRRLLTVSHGTFLLLDTGEAICRAIHSKDGFEFILRLNIIGVGRFAISLFGEAKRAVLYARAEREAEYASKKAVIVEEYIKGLKILAEKYNDKDLLTFVDDFEKSDAYKEAFEKSVKLAELRNVPDEKILKNKSDIDKYFGGK